jgi:predicted DsbA family dithiol-disulfide isomerase
MTDAGPEVTVYSDYVCPFCYLGRRSLEHYESARGESVAIDWRPFDLRAHQRRPDGDLDRSDDDGKDDAYYEQVTENVRRLRERYDAEMSLEVARDVDSLPAQLVSYHLKSAYPAAWREFDEAVFEALWVDRRDIGDPAVLRDLVRAVGQDPALVDEALADDGLRERVREQFADARREGVTGVPTFVHDGYAARGAVPPDQLRRLVEGAEDGRPDPD